MDNRELPVTIFILKKLWFIADIEYELYDGGLKELDMADIIGFPKDELTSGDRKQLEEFVRGELEDIQDKSCESFEEIQDEIMVLAEYFRKFMAVAEDSDTKMNPDLDFSLFLLEGRIRKIRGMIKTLFVADSG